MSDLNQNPKIALLLTGGGARAAYQVGVLKAIAQQYPRNSKSPFQIICGTSAGAINGTAVACYASCFHLGVRKLEWIWKNFHTHHVYYSDYFRATYHLLRGFLSAFQADYANHKPVSLLDNKPLKLLLNELLDLKRLDRNIMGGYLDSVARMDLVDGDQARPRRHRLNLIHLPHHSTPRVYSPAPDEEERP